MAPIDSTPPDTTGGVLRYGGRLELSELDSIGELERLAGEWTALAARCPAATPFQLPEWQLAWWRHLVTGGDLRAVLLRLAGRLVGLAPLFVFGGEQAGEPRQLAALAAGVSDYTDFLLEPGIAEDGAAMILEHLAGSGPQWDVATFDEIPAGSPLVTTPIPAGVAAESGAGSTCLVLELPRTGAELSQRLSPRVRRKLRMGANRLARAGGGTYVRATALNLPVLLEGFFRLHRARWGPVEEPGVLSDPRVYSFLKDAAARMLRAGHLRLDGLEAGGELVSVLFAMSLGGRVYAYLTGFDPAAAYFSPGVTLLRYAIGQAIAEGAAEFDMLRGDEEYKRAWRPAERRNARLALRRG